jgi:peptide/nickel transport system substrate-binding protein/oligopeptide transport system substrate-binding protein
MSNTVRMGLFVFLWVCCSVYILSSSASPETLGPPELHMPGAKFGGIYRRVLDNNPATLDPAFLTDIYGGAVVSQIFDGLVQFDANLKPLPALAEFWEASRDGRTWTFTLRRGVQFHHGREVTAHDVVYSFTRLLHPQKPLPATEFFRHLQGAREFMQGKTPNVQGLKAVDRYTLRMVLEEPLASALALLGLAYAAVVPQDEVERLGDGFGRAPVGTGPFRFVRWEPNQEIVLGAHDHYYEGRPFLDALVFKIVVGGKFEKTFAEFLRGNLEETIIPSGKLDEVRSTPKYQRYQRFRKPALALLYIGFHTRMKPFDDRRVRQAFNYAVDKEAIVRNITRMGSLPATGALPPGMPGYDPTLQGYAYHPERARRLLAEAGYPDGAGFPVVQLWSSDKADSTRAELAAYQRYLAELGVRVDLHFAPNWPTFKKLLEQGQLPMFRLVWGADIPDPDNMLSPLLHSISPTNRTFYRNPRVDQLLEQARKERDEAQRIVLYREVERLVIEDAPWIAQHHIVLDYLYQPYVQGVEVNLLGHRTTPMKKLWLQKSPAAGTVEAITDHEPRQ